MSLILSILISKYIVDIINVRYYTIEVTQKNADVLESADRHA